MKIEELTQAKVIDPKAALPAALNGVNQKVTVGQIIEASAAQVAPDIETIQDNQQQLAEYAGEYIDIVDDLIQSHTDLQKEVADNKKSAEHSTNEAQLTADIAIAEISDFRNYVLDSYGAMRLPSGDCQYPTMRKPLTPLLEAAGFVLNENTGFYELNGLTDITYEQALVIYNRTSGGATFSSLPNYLPFRAGGVPFPGVENSPRTTLHFCRDLSQSYKVSYIAGLEVLAAVDYPAEFTDEQKRAAALYCKGGDGGVTNCPHLREILDPIQLYYATPAYFTQNPELRTVKLFRKGSAGSCTIYLQDSPLLSFESLQYLVDNSAEGLGIITVVLHKDVYNNITGGGTYDEEHSIKDWEDLFDKATEKNISFTEA